MPNGINGGYTVPPMYYGTELPNAILSGNAPNYGPMPAFGSEQLSDDILVRSMPQETPAEEKSSGWGPLKTIFVLGTGAIATVAAVKTGKGLNGKNLGQIFSLKTLQSFGQNLKFWQWPSVQSGISHVKNWFNKGTESPIKNEQNELIKYFRSEGKGG